MATQSFLARIGGFTEQVRALVTSVGATDAGKLVATDTDGRLHPSVLPEGIGSNAFQMTTNSDLTAGMFVAIVSDAGEAVVQPAASSGKPAIGFVESDFLDGDTAFVYPLDKANTKLTGLTPGAPYWLGESGAVTDTPPDETDVANKGHYSQQLGVAVSATELRTSDYGFVRL